MKQLLSKAVLLASVATAFGQCPPYISPISFMPSDGVFTPVCAFNGLSGQLNIQILVDYTKLAAILGVVPPVAMVITGRYVRITQNPPEPDGTQYLSLAEVQVFAPSGVVDLALNQPAVQSSTYIIAPNPTANLAVDGNIDGTFDDGSVSHTAGTEPGWWQVDLGSAQTIGSIVIWNRTDCCADRLTNYTVTVSNNADGTQPVWLNVQTIAPNPNTVIPVIGLTQ